MMLSFYDRNPPKDDKLSPLKHFQWKLLRSLNRLKLFQVFKRVITENTFDCLITKLFLFISVPLFLLWALLRWKEKQFLIALRSKTKKWRRQKGRKQFCDKWLRVDIYVISLSDMYSKKLRQMNKETFSILRRQWSCTEKFPHDFLFVTGFSFFVRSCQ